ncbi:MAG: SH3 domain-containing protein [Acidimicrobiales bacterium]
MFTLTTRHRTASITLGVVCFLALAASGCTYESGQGLAGPEGTEQTTTSTDEVPGPLAFSVEGMASSLWRVYNTDDGLNLRVAPGIDSDSIGRLEAGTMVTSTGEVIAIGETSWFYVETDDQTGWVHSGYLVPVDPDESGVTAAQPTAPLVTIEAAWPADTQLVVASQPGANLREGPAGDIIVELSTGTTVTVTGVATEDWTEIRTSNLRGWIYTELLAEVVDDPGARFPAATPVGPAEGLAGANITDAPEGIVIGGLPAGEVALATGRSQQGWTEVTHRGMNGWILSSELRTVDPAPASLEPTAATVDGAGGPVTIHLGPSGLEPILDEVRDGDQVMTTGLSTPTGWSEIQLDEVRTGWVPTIFLIFPA